MKIHSHSYTHPHEHPQGARLARTEVTMGRQRLVFVDYYCPSPFDQGARRVGREVYRIEDGLEIHIGYLSPKVDQRFAADLAAWLEAPTTRHTTWLGTPMVYSRTPSRSFRAVAS